MLNIVFRRIINIISRELIIHLFIIRTFFSIIWISSSWCLLIRLKCSNYWINFTKYLIILRRLRHCILSRHAAHIYHWIVSSQWGKCCWLHIIQWLRGIRILLSYFWYKRLINIRVLLVRIRRCLLWYWSICRFVLILIKLLIHLKS